MPRENQASVIGLFYGRSWLWLALVYLRLAYTLFSSNDPVKIDRAADLIKTLSAFFIGTATCVMT